MCCDGDKYVSACAGAGAGTGRAGTHSDPHCDFLAWLRAGGNILPTTGRKFRVFLNRKPKLNTFYFSCSKHLNFDP